MPISQDQMAVLMADLNPDRVVTRKQGGADLSYLEAFDVKASLVRVFGFGGFSAVASDLNIVRIEDRVPKPRWNGRQRDGDMPIEFHEDGQVKYGTANYRVTASARVTLTIFGIGPHGQDAVYTEYAAASQTGPDLGEVTDFAIKTAESDALKRAAIYLGTQFGLSLYHMGSTRDIIKVVLAPGQAWARGGPVVRENNGTGFGAQPPAATRPVDIASDLTPEQAADNQALLEKALRMKAAKDAVESHEEEAARVAEAEQEHDPGWPPQQADEM